LGRKGRLLAAALLAALVLFEAVLSFGWSFYAMNPAGVALGKEPRARYLERLLEPRPAAWRSALRLGEMAGAGTRYHVSGLLNAYYWPGLPETDVEGLPSRMMGFAAESRDERWMAAKVRQRGWGFLVERGGAPALPPEVSPDDSGAGDHARRLLASFVAHRTRVVLRIGADDAFFTVRRIVAPKRSRGRP
jgi:hypothetical protein